jgi:hypothetical protein
MPDRATLTPSPPRAPPRLPGTAPEERLSLRRTTRCPCGVLTHDKPPSDIGMAKSLRDELQHVQLPGHQHERERLHGHPPGPFIKVDANRTGQNHRASTARPEHHTSAARKEPGPAMSAISAPLDAMPPGSRPGLRPGAGGIRRSKLPRIVGYGAIRRIAEHHVLPAPNGGYLRANSRSAPITMCDLVLDAA